METGKIAIARTVGGNASVHIELVDGTVWLTKHQIADFFEVFTSAVTSNLKSIFKSRDLKEWEVMKTHRYTDAKGRECQVEFYNLDVLLALCFRLKGEICNLFRQWILERIKKPIVASPKTPILIQLRNTMFI
ncbi:MAG: hypothetical protein RSA53_05905 [Odoribacter sp.]